MSDSSRDPAPDETAGHSAARPLPDLVDKGDIVMLTTMIDGSHSSRHSSRPMTVLDIAGDRLSFLLDTSTPWAAAIADGRAVVHVTLSDLRDNTYLSLNGTASITRDRSEIDRLWSQAAAAFFDGKDDPNLGVLHFDVTDGEYWDSPSGRLGALISLLRAAVDGDSGDHGPVSAG